jgi:hypothetical protein
MIWKELRETSRILLLALVVFIGIAMRHMGFEYLPWGQGSAVALPFIDGDFYVWFGWFAAGLAIALGLSQTLAESVHGTYPFLWHRPASRRWLLGMKLAVGASAYLLCGAIPILIFAFWASTPGTHPGPFCWSMTLHVWTLWFNLLYLYLAAFLSGIRPGRWLGTRLLPLLAAGPVLLFISDDESGGISCFIVLLFEVAALASIFLAARQRDY